MIHYHISKTDLGMFPILKAKVPKAAFKEIEGTTKRVCFSDSIGGCLLSLDARYNSTFLTAGLHFLSKPFNDKILNPTVYVTTTNNLITPPDISDYKETGEKQSLSDIQVVRVGYINLGFLLYLSGDMLVTNNKFTKLTLVEYKLLKKIEFNASYAIGKNKIHPTRLFNE